MKVDTSLAWRSNTINLDEVLRRITAVPLACNAVHRTWRNYVLDRDECIVYLWHTLQPGRPYVVANYTYTSDHTRCAANVLRFERYVKLPPDVVLLREASVKHRIEELQFRMDADDDDDEYDELSSKIEALRSHGLAETFALEFSDLNSPSTKYVIDPFGTPPWNVGEKMYVAVTDVCSYSWTMPRVQNMMDEHGQWIGVTTDRSRALSTMNRLRFLHGEQITQALAARRIQRAWRQCVSNPEHRVCKKRLYAEFLECNKN